MISLEAIQNQFILIKLDDCSITRCEHMLFVYTTIVQIVQVQSMLWNLLESDVIPITEFTLIVHISKSDIVCIVTSGNGYDGSM